MPASFASDGAAGFVLRDKKSALRRRRRRESAGAAASNCSCRQPGRAGTASCSSASMFEVSLRRENLAKETPLILHRRATVMVGDACRRASRVASLASSTAGALQAVLKCALNQRGPRRLVACTSNTSEASSVAAGCVEGLVRAARREAGLAGSSLQLRTLCVKTRLTRTSRRSS